MGISTALNETELQLLNRLRGQCSGSTLEEALNAISALRAQLDALADMLDEGAEFTFH